MNARPTSRLRLLTMLCLLTACSSGGPAEGDACARASASCPGISITSCTPLVECQAQCALDNGCVESLSFEFCVGTRCMPSGSDAGRDSGVSSGDTRTSADDPPPSDSGQGARDSGTFGSDTSSGGGGGGRGCSADDATSCTCAPGVTDDGKGCTTSSLASPGVCCSNDSRCRCQSVTCASNSGGCSCYVSGLPPGSSTSTSCSGPLCCTFPASSSFGFGACTCYAGGKSGGCAVLGGTEVSTCTPSKVPCYYKDEHTVSACH